MTNSEFMESGAAWSSRTVEKKATLTSNKNGRMGDAGDKNVQREKRNVRSSLGVMGGRSRLSERMRKSTRPTVKKRRFGVHAAQNDETRSPRPSARKRLVKKRVRKK